MCAGAARLNTRYQVKATASGFLVGTGASGDGDRSQPARSENMTSLTVARVMIRPRSIGVIRFAGTAVGGRIMKMMTREQLFAVPKLARRAKARIDRGTEAVSAARIRATGIAEQNAVVVRPITRASQRRRLARLRAAES